MTKVILYEYDRKNWNEIEKAFPLGSKIAITGTRFLLENLIEDNDNTFFRKNDYIDLTLVVNGDEERSDIWSPALILLFQQYLQQEEKCTFIIDKRFARIVQDILFYFVKERMSLEKELGLDDTIQTNVVDLSDSQFNEMKQVLDKKMFGNQNFKKRLFEELRNFRYFNMIGEKKVFSVFLCGPTGIGKTETAKILHEYLSPSEKFIKINLGNYSDKNALSSLIGSPRGYTGSSKGELSDKIEKSRSRVILIDEFEKTGPEVHNFFLELLADGQFTDSLGREFDLNKYIIVFTSNIKKGDAEEKITPELKSRFDLMYRMVLLKSEEKQQYIDFKTQEFITKFETVGLCEFTNEEKQEIKRIHVADFDNLRKINRQIEKNIVKIIESKKKK